MCHIILLVLAVSCFVVKLMADWAGVHAPIDLITAGLAFGFTSFFPWAR